MEVVEHLTPYPAQTTGAGIPARISLDAVNVSLANDGTHNTHQLTASITDAQNASVEAANPVVFTTHDPAIATVSTTGLITAVSPGRTTITAGYSPATGVSFDAEVNVLVSPLYPIAPPFSWLGRHWDDLTGEWVGTDIYPQQ